MRNMKKNSDQGMGSEALGAGIPVTPRETFVNGVYVSVDEAAACGLDRLRCEAGIIPTCKLGCCHCCRYLILMNIAEAHTLTQYIKREWSADQINDLRIRTQEWHEWDHSRPGRFLPANINTPSDFSNYDHCCPLLVNSACSAYPVRPVVCRTHFVCSDRLFCRAANDPRSTQKAPVVLTSVVMSTHQFSMALREHVENAGLDFSRSIMLLPHWLATEMGWNFAVTL